jgi:DNA-binding PadR family transcriptional regulator
MVEVHPEVLADPPPGVLCARRIDDHPLRSTRGRALKDPDTKKQEWLKFRLQASNGFTGLPNRMLDSKPYAMLTTGAEVKSLTWFWQDAKYEKKKRKPGTDSPIGRIDKITNNGEISFTFQQAEWRGVKPRTFYRVVRKLHRLGFIDIATQGRGKKNEFTKYALSDRWKRYDTPEWKEIPFPEPYEEGFASKEFQEKQRERRLKKGGQKSPLPMVRNVHYALAEAPSNGQKSPRETPDSLQSQWTGKSTSIDSVMGSGSKKRIKKKVRTLNSRSKVIAAARKTKKHSAAIPAWPDQGKVLDLSDALILDAFNQFGGNGDQHHPEMSKAHNLADIINKAVGSKATN